MNFEDSVKKHAEWKLKFRSAITRHETLDAARIGDDKYCELGRWLHGEGKSAFGARAEFASALQQHAAFHVEAGKVARLINGQRFAEAEKAIGPGTPFSAISSAVGVALMTLKRATATH